MSMKHLNPGEIFANRAIAFKLNPEVGTEFNVIHGPDGLWRTIVFINDMWHVTTYGLGEPFTKSNKLRGEAVHKADAFLAAKLRGIRKAA